MKIKMHLQREIQKCIGKDLDKKYLDINIKKNRKSIGKMYRFVRKKEFDQKNV